MNEPFPLEALLEAPPEVLPDAGFTLRVLAALPPRKQGQKARPWIVMGATALGGVLALSAPGSREVLGQAALTLTRGQAPLLMLGALLLASLWLTTLREA